MRKLLYALLFTISATPAWAQCAGIFPPNTVCGNNTASPNVPTAVAFGGSVSGPGVSVTNDLALWGNTGGTALIDGGGHTIPSNYTWSGTNTYSGTVNFTSTFQIGGSTITWPAGAGTLAFLAGTNTWSGPNNFTSTFQKSGSTMTFPGSPATLAALNIADQTLSGGANVTSNNLGSKSAGFTVDCGLAPLQFFTNGGGVSWNITAPANDGSCDILDTNGASAATIGFTGFTAEANHGDPLTTTNTNKFIIHIERINASATYIIHALQ